MAKQTSTQTYWEDESGLKCLYSRTTEVERLKEIQADRLLTKAQKINEQLTEFKNYASEICDKILEMALKEADASAKKHKGNFTWYNYDRSIKVEVSVSERIEFDDVLITAARERFEQFIEGGTSGVDEMIKAMILEAFETRKGQLDPKRVMSLLRYKSKVSEQKYPQFHEAIDLIEKSIRRPESKRYFRIWQKNIDGKFESVELNFSNI